VGPTRAFPIPHPAPHPRPPPIPAGQPGDTVTVERQPGVAETLTIPRGHVWVVGDNAAASIDCRYYGPVPAALVTGKVLCRIWPPSSAGALPPAPGCAVGEGGKAPPTPPTVPVPGGVGSA